MFTINGAALSGEKRAGSARLFIRCGALLGRTGLRTADAGTAGPDRMCHLDRSWPMMGTWPSYREARKMTEPSRDSALRGYESNSAETERNSMPKDKSISPRTFNYHLGYSGIYLDVENSLGQGTQDRGDYTGCNSDQLPGRLEIRI